MFKRMLKIALEQKNKDIIIAFLLVTLPAIYIKEEFLPIYNY